MRLKIFLCVAVTVFVGILIGGVFEFFSKSAEQSSEQDVYTIVPSPWTSEAFLLVNYADELKEWSPSTGQTNTIPLPFKKTDNINEMYIYPYKDGILLYTQDQNENNKLYFAENEPTQGSGWEPIRVNFKGFFLGALEGNFISIENNQLNKTNPSTDKTTAWFKVENNPITSPRKLLGIPSPDGLVGITQGSGGVIRAKLDSNSYEKVFNLPPVSPGMMINTSMVQLSYVESPYGKFVFINEPNNGEYLSSDGGKSFEPANSGLENYYIVNVIYDQASSRILAFTYSGKHVFSFNPANKTWSSLQVNSPWTKID